MAGTLDDDATIDDFTETTPWHLWAIGAVAFLWNGVPAVDSTLTLFSVAGWTSTVDPDVLGKIHSAPIWANAAWLAGGWGGLCGAILLLARSRYAPYGFMASLAGAAISFSWQFSVGLHSSSVIPAIILASEILFWWYAGKMRDAGVLT